MTFRFDARLSNVIISEMQGPKISIFKTHLYYETSDSFDLACFLTFYQKYGNTNIID